MKKPLMVRETAVAEPEAITLIGSMILQGDSLHILRRLPCACVQCIVTSPPYWGLRDYDITGQIGLENSLTQYVNRLVAVFNEAKRVLKDDGIFWLNIGDGYTSGNRGWRAPDKKNPARAMSVRPDTPEGLKPKDLLGVPWRLAFALQQDGWYLRCDVVWNKPNAMPESVKDRPTRAHEYIFMLTKAERYFYDYKAVMEQNGLGHKHTAFSGCSLRHLSACTCPPLHTGWIATWRLYSRSFLGVWNRRTRVPRDKEELRRD
jgi:site-specific DNA-methyltransferase (adenine-specific)